MNGAMNHKMNYLPANFAHSGKVIDSLVRFEFGDSFTANVTIVPLQIAVRVILLRDIVHNVLNNPERGKLNKAKTH